MRRRPPAPRPRSLLHPGALRRDATAGLVVGVESVPDGLANGLLAAVDPVAGLYGHLFGMVGAALFTSTALMTVQGTGAMAVLVADVDLAGRDDPAAALATLSFLTGALMVYAGLLRLGSSLRFVSNSVMTGFVAAVGANIVLGQLDNLTGYAATGGNRAARALDLLVHPGRVDPPSLLVGAVTVATVLVLRRTGIGPLGLVVAVLAGSAAAALLASIGHGVALVGGAADLPRGLPRPAVPTPGLVPSLIGPAASLAFVGLVQGAGVSAGCRNPDGTPSDASQDFVGQGAGNLLSGIFRGVPVGGSMSATSLASSAGAQTRAALLVASVVMGVVTTTLADAVERIATPALAALLVVVGVGTVKPRKLVAVARTGPVPLTVMSLTLVLTVLVPLQYAVLLGVGTSALLFVVGQSTRLTVRRIEFRDGGRWVEVDPPAELGAEEVVVLQPYGAVFFAAAPALRAQLPSVSAGSRHAVVVLRLRGADDAGATLLDELGRYAAALAAADSKLVVVTDNHQFIRQLRVSGMADRVDVYAGTAAVGEAVERAHDEALAWVAARRGEAGGP